MSGTHFTCFTGTAVQILTPEELRGGSGACLVPNLLAKQVEIGTQFTCVRRVVETAAAAYGLAVPHVWYAVYLLYWYSSTNTDT